MKNSADTQITNTETHGNIFNVRKKYLMGRVSELIIENDNRVKICSFNFNMKGYTPNFELTNNEGIEWNFQERAESTQLKELKRAFKEGYNLFKNY